MRKAAKIALGVVGGILVICYGPALSILLATSVYGLVVALIHRGMLP